MNMPVLQQLKRTPLHPQWFAFRGQSANLRNLCRGLSGLVLDIGCAESKPRRFLPEDARYIGLDYFDTATKLYKTRPSVFGDAQQLPLDSATIDHVLLLDVLEHIPDPDRCLAEIFRVLKAGGTLTVQVPFMYPIHDAPYDFHRWTSFGLQRAAERAGFQLRSLLEVGHPLETAALGANIAMSKTVLNWISARNPLLLLGLTLPFLVLLTNTLAWIMARVGRRETMMPYSYRAVWEKS